MTEGGYGVHSLWGNLVDLIRKLGVKALKKQAGIQTL